MREFTIRLRSVRDVQDFVSAATTMGFPVLVSDGRHKVNGSSFMEMFCLDCTAPLTIFADCSDGDLELFLNAARDFLVK